ncbi:MAG: hypothetical protein ACLUKN_07325 [Bacilli bacterium]
MIGDTSNADNSWSTESNWLLEDKSEYGKLPQEGDNIVIDSNYLTFGTGNPRLFMLSDWFFRQVDPPKFQLNFV